MPFFFMMQKMIEVTFPFYFCGDWKLRRDAPASPRLVSRSQVQRLKPVRQNNPAFLAASEASDTQSSSPEVLAARVSRFRGWGQTSIRR